MDKGLNGKRRMLSADEIQNKVNRDALMPLQMQIEDIAKRLTPSDRPSKKYPKGTLKYITAMRQIEKIKRRRKKIEKALNDKVNSMNRQLH